VKQRVGSCLVSLLRCMHTAGGARCVTETWTRCAAVSVVTAALTAGHGGCGGQCVLRHEAVALFDWQEMAG
jgi:hypothetical protein